MYIYTLYILYIYIIYIIYYIYIHVYIYIYIYVWVCVITTPNMDLTGWKLQQLSDIIRKQLKIYLNLCRIGYECSENLAESFWVSFAE